MIKLWSYDVECFKNLFSITFVNMTDYFNKFSDCVDKKGKPIPMTECISVDEIEKRLSEIETKIFWISDEDDSMLLELVSFINSMAAYYETKVDENDVPYQVPVRTDCYGFNCLMYDDTMIKAFMMYFNQFTSTKALLQYLYQLSKKITAKDFDKSQFYEDSQLKTIRGYRLPYKTVDVQLIYGLHSASVREDKDTKERVKFGKSLKQTSINLKWYNLLDFVLPPIDEYEKVHYYDKELDTKGMTIEQLNLYITKDFDRYVQPKYIEHMLKYNANDCFIVIEIVRLKMDEVKLRYSITNAFKVDVMCSARPSIADKLIIHFYSKYSGLHKDSFIKKRTERHKLSFNKVIFSHIKFKTKQLQDFLEDIKKVSIYRTTKSEFERTLNFYGTEYTIATGGIHTKDMPRILVSDDNYIYIHHDYTSYYPSIMINYDICPDHLNPKVFNKMLAYFKDTRVKCKHAKKEDGYIIAGVDNKVAAEALKIVINSIYGKLGSETFMLYDRLAQLKVTINGQLMTMTLVEELELNGIHVVSANTDGIVIKLPKDKFQLYQQIAEDWNKTNKMSADYEIYKMVVSRDINNYFDIQENDAIEYKGALDPKQYLNELKKGYDMPVVKWAVFEYFVNNVPVMDTLRGSKDILAFCKTQNVGSQFEVITKKVVDSKIKIEHLQRHNRFYVAKHGTVIMKQGRDGTISRLASGLPVIAINKLDDKPIEERDIDYNYYYAEAYKIIDAIKLGISPTQKGGKTLIKKYSHMYNTLFDLDEE